ncbi:MspA family porin [Mycobacterium sp. M26]|uniref:MspA family porin n=1 Tax=Mycobacterium sp. M26 TaxID=1762962 RepID=UPI00073E84D4|nr:MspA family porin [Mycobacterium sp. M26]
MLLRFATVTASVLVAVGTAAPAYADPDPASPPADPAAAAAPPPVNTGVVASSVPGIAKTADGRTLTVVAKDETQLPVAPLTTSLSSRDWVVGATFTGNTTGDTAGGTLEVGYQIGCSVEMDKVKLNGSVGASLGNASLGTGGFTAPGTISFPIQGQIEVEPRPGTITNVVVDKKSFKGTSARVTIRDVHIKVDNCVGASSLRSYAVLTSSSTDNDDIVAYYGITQVF